MPEATALKPWLDLLVSPGVPIIITLLVIWGVIKYTPKLMEALIKFINESPGHLAIIATKLTEIVKALKEIRYDLRLVRRDADQIRVLSTHMLNGIDGLIELPTIQTHIPRNSIFIKELRSIRKLLEEDDDSGIHDSGESL